MFIFFFLFSATHFEDLKKGIDDANFTIALDTPVMQFKKHLNELITSEFKSMWEHKDSEIETGLNIMHDFQMKTKCTQTWLVLFAEFIFSLFFLK